MRNVLLLSQGYQPLRTIPWKKAVGLCIGREKAEIIVGWEEADSRLFNASVIRLLVPSPDPFKIFQKQKFSKKNLFVRDRFKCQYCVIPLTIREGTIDHVVPRAQGGRTTYLNCVAACKKCNSKKDNNTPDQAKMPLHKPLRYPNMYDAFDAMEIPDEWSMFIKK